MLGWCNNCFISVFQLVTIYGFDVIVPHDVLESKSTVLRL